MLQNWAIFQEPYVWIVLKTKSVTFHHSKNCWNVWNHTHSAPTNSICKLLTHIFFSASTPLCRLLSVHFLICSTLKMIKLIKWEMSNCIKRLDEVILSKYLSFTNLLETSNVQALLKVLNQSMTLKVTLIFELLKLQVDNHWSLS